MNRCPFRSFCQDSVLNWCLPKKLLAAYEKAVMVNKKNVVGSCNHKSYFPFYRHIAFYDV